MSTKARANRPGIVANPRRAADAKLVALDDSYLVTMGGRANRVHRLNASAALVLELADGTLSVPRIAALVAEAYRLPAPPVADVRRVLEQMAAIGLVTMGAASSRPKRPRPAARKATARRKASARPRRRAR